MCYWRNAIKNEHQAYHTDMVNEEIIIIDEYSMTSRDFIAQLSFVLSFVFEAITEQQQSRPFGGLNVIICGGFHRFPPVRAKRSEPLYWLRSQLYDTPDEKLGREIYEQFTMVVILKEQRRVTDPEWIDLLRHARHITCRNCHVCLFGSRIIGRRECPPTDSLYRGIAPN